LIEQLTSGNLKNRLVLQGSLKQTCWRNKFDVPAITLKIRFGSNITSRKSVFVDINAG
jgi:hypothetical protein